MTEDPRQARSTDQIGHHAIEIRERRRRVLSSRLGQLMALLTSARNHYRTGRGARARPGRRFQSRSSAADEDNCDPATAHSPRGGTREEQAMADGDKPNILVIWRMASGSRTK